MKLLNKKNILKKISESITNMPLSISGSKNLNDPHLLLNRKDFIKRSMGMLAFVTVPVISCGNAFDSDTGNDDTNEPEYKISFEITFSEPMDISSAEAAVSISPDPGSSDGNFIWSENDTVLYYESQAAEGELYQVTIAGSAMDKAGNYLDGNNDNIGGDSYSFDINAV